MHTWDEVYEQLGLVHESREDRAFWRLISRSPSPRPEVEVTDNRVRFVMSMVAFHSQQLENAGWDRWELHTDALMQAYQMGQRKQPVNIYHFLTWHKAILPFGGTLRDCNPVSIGMGDSFAPVPVHLLPKTINDFVRGWNDFPADVAPLAALARRHFDQWQKHPFSDGNKRHCRLMTVYGCGWFGLDPVMITLGHKQQYLDALAGADLPALAVLFEQCQVALV